MTSQGASNPQPPEDDARLTRLRERVEALAAISEPGDGVTRLAFTQLERDAHALVASWAVESGAEAISDGIGNSVFVFRKGEPYLLIGSHVDSVGGGGRYDGVVGVLAALEVASELKDRVRQGVRVVVFSAEEGARFGLPCLGSSLAAGQMGAADLDRLVDKDGTSALDAARRVGLTPESCEPWARRPAVAAFIELHIEQGMSLESERVSLGVVDVIAGTERLKLTVVGRPEHSGATPMRMRADALAAASEIVLATETIGRDARTGTATIGRLTVEPNGVTTIPGRVRAVVDIRNADKAGQDEAVSALRAAVEAVAARREVHCELEPVGKRDPVMLSAWVRAGLKQACEALQLSYRILPSGAGHDAAILAMGAPAGMLFVATPNGLSHVPHEACRLTDVSLACSVISNAMLTLDEQSASG